jgi:hypothetical protein
LIAIVAMDRKFGTDTVNLINSSESFKDGGLQIGFKSNGSA